MVGKHLKTINTHMLIVYASLILCECVCIAPDIATGLFSVFQGWVGMSSLRGRLTPRKADTQTHRQMHSLRETQ